MDLNDQLGCCCVAGAQHETMLFNAERNVPVAFSDANTVANYRLLGGYNPADPSSDGGCDMLNAAEARRTTGIVDAAGTTHKIAAHVSLTPGNVGELRLAMWLFGAVGIGIEFPAFAQSTFNTGKWDVQTTNTGIEGGHYISGVGYHNGATDIVTWGRQISMTDAFYRQYNDESIAYLSEEMLTNGKSLDGFDLAALQADLATLPQVA
jgi:hypothetical protein